MELPEVAPDGFAVLKKWRLPNALKLCLVRSSILSVSDVTLVLRLRPSEL
jgi:hypothetical protein